MKTDIYEHLIGRRIYDLKMYNDKLHLWFDDHNITVIVRNAGQRCCENRYLHTDDVLEQYKGAVFLSFEVKATTIIDDGTAVTTEAKFLEVKTSLGIFTIVCHNGHTGHYAGFNLKVSVEGDLK